MKRIIRKFSLLFPVLLCIQGTLYAQDDNENMNKDIKGKKYEFVKKKSINKSYNVSSADKLKIQNSFGTVEVHTWDKSEIKIDVNVEVSANTEAYADKILDRITVTDEQSGKEITLKTNIKDISNSKGEKSSMNVNYSISMPAANPLLIKNEFGATILPDYKGEVDLTSKFGSLTTGNLSNVKNLSVEFGKAKIGNISGGAMTIKYSNASFTRLSGVVKLNLEFCSKVVLNLDENLNSFDLKASYSTVNLKPMGDLPVTYNISTSFGSLKNKTSVKFDSDEDDDKTAVKFDHLYTGKSGNGNIPVKVKANFSTIILGDASDDDFKDKHKSKSKSVEI